MDQRTNILSLFPVSLIKQSFEEYAGGCSLSQPSLKGPPIAGRIEKNGFSIMIWR